MSPLDELKEAVIRGDIAKARAETENAINAQKPAQDILDQALVPAMDDVGERFSKGTVFVPQMLRSAKTMQECVKLLEPHFQEGDLTRRGRVVIGTVKGDLHDIGKNLVSMMMEGAGFIITDLGVDVPPEKFAQKAQEVEADIVALSALLSTTMPAMPETIESLKKAGIRDKVKVLVGGAPVTDKYAESIQADGYAPDAGSAVTRAKELLNLT